MNRRRYGIRRWCLRLGKGAGGLIALVLLGFLLLQALFYTPWMRGKVASKLSQRVGGLEVLVSEVQWTPWSGATLRGLEIKQPEALRELVSTPLLEIEEIHAWPDYRAALKRQWTASEVTFVRPKFHVTAEMLVSIAASSMPAVEAPPVIASAQPPPAPVQALVPDGVPAAGAIVADPAVAGAQAVASAQAKEAPDPAPAPEAKVLKKKLRVVVEDGSFEFVRAKGNVGLLAIEGMNFDLPIFGGPQGSQGSIASIRCLGQSLAESVAFKADPENVGVTLSFAGDPNTEFGIFGKCGFGLIRGLPIQADLILRMPSVGPVTLSKDINGQAAEARVRLQFAGWLQVPGSWRGMGAFEADCPAASIFGQSVGFDSGAAVVQLAGGLIQSPDFRLIGDSASILGNAWVTSGNGAMVVRLVVPYPVVGILNEAVRKRIPETVFAFRPLNPDNRWYSDVSLWREEMGWSVGFGEGGTVMTLDEVLAGNKTKEAR